MDGGVADRGTLGIAQNDASSTQTDTRAPRENPAKPPSLGIRRAPLTHAALSLPTCSRACVLLFTFSRFLRSWPRLWLVGAAR